MRQLKISKGISNRENISLDDYLQATPTTSFDEEKELYRRIKEGDIEALDILTESFQNIVVEIAKQYLNKGVELPALIEMGNDGIAKGVEEYDENKGFYFRPYISWWIRQTILEGIKNK